MHCSEVDETATGSANLWSLLGALLLPERVERAWRHRWLPSRASRLLNNIELTGRCWSP
jgi:hypothetical protein